MKYVAVTVSVDATGGEQKVFMEKETEEGQEKAKEENEEEKEEEEEEEKEDAQEKKGPEQDAKESQEKTRAEDSEEKSQDKAQDNEGQRKEKTEKHEQDVHAGATEEEDEEELQPLDEPTESGSHAHGTRRRHGRGDKPPREIVRDDFYSEFLIADVDANGKIVVHTEGATGHKMAADARRLEQAIERAQAQLDAVSRRASPAPSDGDSGGADEGGDDIPARLPTWSVGNWSECSSPCGGGTQSRSVDCIDETSGTPLPLRQCEKLEQPTERRDCSLCLDWVMTNWTTCSVTCGGGSRLRQVFCPREGHCDEGARPAVEHPCSMRTCVDWVAGPWSQCSLTCGDGTRKRHVRCVDLTNDEPAGGCDTDSRPATMQSCNTRDCPQTKQALRSCHDMLGATSCGALKHMCSTHYFRVRCCATCLAQTVAPPHGGG
ncbi:PREDICTED: A disintegrin and metalloproteinase with thrombospondin motifs 7-like [Priapulus caudatus]|uniref:A disintegrin and metalloproteinase with thrombospondin motifs 7-like n=1 Tax=Priapulus caudatus TaxID=37621 RepID=A0ABM1EFE9_PRICU|nr:PREDICTED: A disintegrin and metalloproteinase with thrombospondin motifs 7-like [Priapulus caudatus]